MQLPDDLVLKGMELKDQYFDLKGLSVYSSFCVSTLRGHIRGDGLPCYQLKGKILVRKSEFDEWLKRFKVNGSMRVDKIVDEVVKEIGLASRRSQRIRD